MAPPVQDILEGSRSQWRHLAHPGSHCSIYHDHRTVKFSLKLCNLEDFLACARGAVRRLRHLCQLPRLSSISVCGRCNLRGNLLCKGCSCPNTDSNRDQNAQDAGVTQISSMLNFAMRSDRLGQVDPTIPDPPADV